MITVRKKKFDFNNSNKYYYRDSKLITHFFNALSSTFPPGEEFFVRSVRRFRKNNKSDLEKSISGFIGQEAWHTIAHQTLNRYAEENNVPLEKWDAKIDWLLKYVETKITAKQCLAVTVALEHYTATMGKEILTNHKWLSHFEEPYRELIEWHSTEEVEHKTVAYDVYLRENGDYFTRASVMLGASILFWVIISFMTAHLFLTDKDMSLFEKCVELKHGLYELLGPNGFITNIAKDIPQYFKPNFHPSQI